MASPINKATYTTLFDYSVLAQSGITSATATTINGVSYGNYGGTGQITGTYNGTATLVVGAIPVTVNNQLNSLVSAINAITATGDYALAATNGFFPGIKYSLGANDIIPSGTLTFDAGGNANAQFFIVTPTGGYSITFNNPVTFVLNGGAQASNVFWLANTSGLISAADLAGFGVPSQTIQGNLISASAVTVAGVKTVNGNIFAQGTNVTFAANTTVNGVPVCYLKGTKILTQNGYVLVEDLKPGDHVVTKGKIMDNLHLQLDEDQSVEPIVWIGKFQAPNLTVDSLPICIKAHALGENLPFEDLYVSPGHRIIIDCKMVCARDLINETTVFQNKDLLSVHYYHFELKEHASVIANGLLSESYLDYDTRGIFENVE